VLSHVLGRYPHWGPCSSVMLPSVSFLGNSIPSYWLCSLLGIIVCLGVALLNRHRFREIDQVDLTNSVALSCIGMVIGARLLYIITISPSLIKNIHTITRDIELAYKILSNGLVFYGGLFGAIASIYLYTKKYQLSASLFFDYYSPLFPLFHAFGRIGCFLTGCCYGKESSHFGIAFHACEIAPNNVPLIPVQLIGSILNLLLFAFLLLFERSHHKKGETIYWYLLFYSIGRFFIEFLRGDVYRGIFLSLSSSQWISILILIALTFRFAQTRKSYRVA